MMNIYHTILAEGNGGAVKLCQKEAGAQSHELTNRNSIQGQVRGRVCTTRRSPDFTEHGKCCGCVVKVRVLIRGDLSDVQLDKAALQVATFVVIREESAEAVVAYQKRRAKHELGEGTDELL
jgi:hypothetical protein